MIARKCRQDNVPTAQPIAADNGDFYIKHAGKYYVLTHALNGNVLAEANSEGGRLLGQAIARFQNAVAGLPRDVFPKYERHYSTQLDKLEKLRQTGKNIDALIELFETDDECGSLASGIIHRDPNPGNMLFFEGRLTGFLDFDLVKVGPRIFDPCYCATGFLVDGWQEEPKREKWLGMLTSIVGGYFETVQPPFQEQCHIWTMLLEIQLIFIIWFAETNQSSKADVNEEVFMWLVDNKAAIDRAVGSR